MIAWIKGILREKQEDSAVVDVGGIGYRVFLSGRTLQELPPEGEVVELKTHMIVREDGIQLFGFHEEEERQVFLALLSVNGVGPKLSRLILSGISPKQLVQAVVQGRSERLEAIPGVGKRMAQRIVVELKGKLETIFHERELEAAQMGGEMDEGAFRDVVSALTNLGYNLSSARKAAALARGRLKGEVSLEGWVKEALRVLGA
jgi:Holliday junction DNA helicase RuvA